MNIRNAIIAFCSLMFFMIGADKFFHFLEPPCSLEKSIPTIIWSILGVLQLASAVLIWMPKFRKYVAGFFCVFMLVFSLVHLSQGTYDIGGSAFMAVLLGILIWNPKFIGSRKK